MIRVHMLAQAEANELMLLSPRPGGYYLEAEALSPEVQSSLAGVKCACMPPMWETFIIQRRLFLWLHKMVLKRIWILVHFKKLSVSVESMIAHRAWKLNFLPVHKIHVTSLKSSTV